jgi:hypothetical protein
MFTVPKKLLLSLLVISGLALACGPADQPSADETPATPAESTATSTDPSIVEIKAVDFAFVAPGEIPSGWVTFRFVNEGMQEHFALLWKLPPGKTMEDYIAEVGEVFGSVWERYEAGELDREGAGAALGEQLPEWFFTEAVASGGPALTEGGATSQTTVFLEPGTYAVECYVKSPEGVWHNLMGMMHELTVTDEANGASEPAADIEMTLSNYQIDIDGSMGAGTQTVAVHVQDTPEGFMSHDINLFRIDNEDEVPEIVGWMDWMDLEAFRAPAPGYSLGGVEHLTAGATGYFTVDLEPGLYAWVSEGYGAQGMTRTFVVE